MAEEEKKGKAVTFSPEQIKLVNEMIANSRKGDENKAPNAISMYNLRDPKEIKTITISRFDGKYVLGFKNLQKDIYKKHLPLYYRMGVEPIRKLNNEPYVTLLLTDDGEKVEEKEVMLVTFTDSRDRVVVPVIKIDEKTITHDHGVLGNGGNYAIAIDEKGNPEQKTSILAQSQSVERVFWAQPEGFKEPHGFITDFLS
jgi:hypothetical protein